MRAFLNTQRGRTAVALAVAIMLVLGAAWAVFADYVVNTIDTTVDPDLETVTIPAGGSTAVGFYIRPVTGGGDASGCNATGNEPATITLSVPAGVAANPGSLTFTGCGEVNAQNVTFSSSTPGTYTITVASVTGGKSGSLWDISPAAFTLIVQPPPDSTPPVITPNISGTLGDNGWYVSDVVVAWTISDPESPYTIIEGCADTTINTDTAGTTLTCTASSAGGTSSASVTIKRDATPPTISGSRSPAANENGWNNTDVTVSFTCSDGLSGIDSCSGPTVLSGEGAGQSVTGTAVDKAGNSASATVGDINIDKTPPTISGSRTPAANANGWNNTDVTVSFTCSDGLSGIASCSGPTVLSGEGAGQSVTGTAVDKAGNSASETVSGINIDKTPPSLSNLMANPNPAAVKTAVTLSATVGDALSGVAAVVYEYSLDGGSTWVPAIATSSPWSVVIGPFAEAHVIMVRAHSEDAAGNRSSEDAILLAVYDPSGGFVTGGGWINSPAGAYAADPTLAGKATFGFVAKYQKGANVPVGNTEFQFHVANFRFKSTVYEWLVVAGAKAQFKGSGTVNGAGDYGFMLTAIDGQVNGGGVDKFRIKIWDKSTGAIVYDNQMGESDTADPVTAVMGGSIVIHK